MIYDSKLYDDMGRSIRKFIFRNENFIIAQLIFVPWADFTATSFKEFHAKNLLA